MRGSKNISLMKPYNSLTPSIVIGPGDDEIIAFEAKTLPYML